jgi:hypothetical protein
VNNVRKQLDAVCAFEMQSRVNASPVKGCGSQNKTAANKHGFPALEDDRRRLLDQQIQFIIHFRKQTTNKRISFSG